MNPNAMTIKGIASIQLVIFSNTDAIAEMINTHPTRVVFQLLDLMLDSNVFRYASMILFSSWFTVLAISTSVTFRAL